MFRFGLIGYPLSHSFSQKYFSEKFDREGIGNCQYELLPLEDIREFPALLSRFPDLVGLNVTIPHKETVVPYLHELDPAAQEIGAVNTICRIGNKLKGYNTDAIGFHGSLRFWLPDTFRGSALILGTGGSSKAVAYVLKSLKIPFQKVSRSPEHGQLSYSDLREKFPSDCRLIINTTPLGMSPNTDTKPAIPYGVLNPKYYIYDLVYNPEKTKFLRIGGARGAQTMNGMVMLRGQAEAAWKIWTEELPIIQSS